MGMSLGATSGNGRRERLPPHSCHLSRKINGQPLSDTGNFAFECQKGVSGLFPLDLLQGSAHIAQGISHARMPGRTT